MNSESRSYIEYDETQKAEFCTLAQEVGIGRSIRELGYPKSYATAIRWMDQRGIKPNLDKVMQKAKMWHTFYEMEDLLEQVDTAMAVTQEILVNAETPDDVKKCAEALQKLVNTRLLLEGKATSISEKREKSHMDVEIEEMLREERAKNLLKRDNVEVN